MADDAAGEMWRGLSVDNDFGGDETANFGPRQESGSSLYQVLTTVSVTPQLQDQVSILYVCHPTPHHQVSILYVCHLGQ